MRQNVRRDKIEGDTNEPHLYRHRGHLWVFDVGSWCPNLREWNYPPHYPKYQNQSENNVVGEVEAYLMDAVRLSDLTHCLTQMSNEIRRSM